MNFIIDIDELSAYSYQKYVDTLYEEIALLTFDYNYILTDKQNGSSNEN